MTAHIPFKYDFVGSFLRPEAVQNAKSFRMIFDTVKKLRHSQGFYSKLYNDLMEDIKYNKENISDFLNNSELPKFKDTLDVVMYLEG